MQQGPYLLCVLTHLIAIGNVMVLIHIDTVLKPFETSLSIVYTGKGDVKVVWPPRVAWAARLKVKVRREVKEEHSKFQNGRG